MGQKIRSQIPRRISHLNRKLHAGFDYSLDYKNLDLRKSPDLYKVGRSEQGVLLVEPYKSEILSFWKFKTPTLAKKSAQDISKMFYKYKDEQDFVGMDMARKFLQMGYTRSRRYANHKSGRKYNETHEVQPFENDQEKARSAEIFKAVWRDVEADPEYVFLKAYWKLAFG